MTAESNAMRLRLRIKSGPQDDPNDWDEQVRLIKASGAQFESDQFWYPWIDRALSDHARGLISLLNAAEKYGTFIGIDKIETEAGRMKLDVAVGLA